MTEIPYEITDRSGAQIRLEIKLPGGDTLEHSVPQRNFRGLSDDEAKTELDRIVKRVAKPRMEQESIPDLPTEGKTHVEHNDQ